MPGVGVLSLELLRRVAPCTELRDPRAGQVKGPVCCSFPRGALGAPWSTERDPAPGGHCVRGSSGPGKGGSGSALWRAHRGRFAPGRGAEAQLPGAPAVPGCGRAVAAAAAALCARPRNAAQDAPSAVPDLGGSWPAAAALWLWVGWRGHSYGWRRSGFRCTRETFCAEHGGASGFQGFPLSGRFRRDSAVGLVIRISASGCQHGVDG